VLEVVAVVLATVLEVAVALEVEVKVAVAMVVAATVPIVAVGTHLLHLPPLSRTSVVPPQPPASGRLLRT
jgi:hypothetical protein